MFWFLFTIYIIIGLSFLPLFVKSSYKQSLERKNKKWPGLVTGNELEARQACG